MTTDDSCRIGIEGASSRPVRRIVLRAGDISLAAITARSVGGLFHDRRRAPADEAPSAVRPGGAAKGIASQIVCRRHAL
jgi:hypothetical protein